MQKSTKIFIKINQLNFMLLLLILPSVINAQADCTSKPFPSKIPMKYN